MRAAGDIIAIVLIGDGAVGALTPARHARRYVRGPSRWRESMRWFANRPQLTRGLALVELASGLALTLGMARRVGERGTR